MAIIKRAGGKARTPNQMMLRRTLFLMSACGIVAFIVLGVQLFRIQIIEHNKYESLAVEQQVRETTVTAPRGTIFDANMKILAMSASVDTIYISPAEIVMYEESPEFIASSLSEILGVDYETILKKSTNTNSWYERIATKVEKDVSDAVREFKNEYDLKGVKIEADTKRYYPYGTLASHVIGYVGTDNYGLAGLEATYDEYLEGVNGRVVRAKNAYGTDMLFTKFEDYYDAEPGNDVILTIDSTVQYYLEKHLEQAIADYDVQNGAAGIVMDVNTGAIRAMASLGNFDLNNYQAVDEKAQEEIDAAEDDEAKSALLAEAQQLQWLNKALYTPYEPGSTFKIFTLSMALEEGLAKDSDSFYCGGSLDGVPGRTSPVNCWRTTGHGSQTLTQAVQHSCNVAFVNLGLKIGAEKFYEYVRAFGFRDRTGIDLGGESYSVWWSDDAFTNPRDKSSLAAASFGQTFNITPLQLITAVSACANGGYLMKPYVVSQVLDAEGGVVAANEPTVVRQVISEETSAKVCEMLEQVVGGEEGTGKNAYVAGYRVAGKTGTSTDTRKEADTGVKQYIVSFIGFAPADKPEVAVLILLDNPSGKTGYVSGGQMAAPTVGNILSDVLPYMGVEAQYTEDEKVILDKTVPFAQNLTVDEATARMSEEGLSVRVIGSGETVTSQLPLAGSVVAAETQVILYCGAEPSAGTEQMPNLTGMSYSTARQFLGNYGLFVRASGGATPGSGNIVISTQSIAAGAEVPYGTIVEVTLVDTSMVGRY